MLPRGPGFLPQDGNVHWSQMQAQQGPIQYPHPPYMTQMSGPVPPLFYPYPLQYPHGPEHQQVPPIPPRTNDSFKTNDEKKETGNITSLIIRK